MPHSPSTKLAYQGLRRERVIASPRFRDGIFHNTLPITAGLQGSSMGLMRDYACGKEERVPKGIIPTLDPKSTWQTQASHPLRATWLGHSTVLLECNGLRVLTDPVWGRRASPLSFAGPKRFVEVPVAIDELPPIDVILLSHDHYDHLCSATIRDLVRAGTPIVTSLGVGFRLERLGANPSQIHELDWGETYQHATGDLQITATPSQHFSGRSLADRNATLWSSWVIVSRDARIFFSGDTGLTEEFKQIAIDYGPFDMSLIEIGASDPRWKDIHLGPDNAATAFEWLGGGSLLPVHWGTFNLALHAWDAPAIRLHELANQRKIHALFPKIGEVFYPKHDAPVAPWWEQVSR